MQDETTLKSLREGDRPLWYNWIDGEPVPISAELAYGILNDLNRRRVGFADLGFCQVSTVFLVLDHGWRSPQPVLFETMIFCGDRDGEQWRFCTLKEAQAFHAQLVNELRWEFDPLGIMSWLVRLKVRAGSLFRSIGMQRTD